MIIFFLFSFIYSITYSFPLKSPERPPPPQQRTSNGNDQDINDNAGLFWRKNPHFDRSRPKIEPVHNIGNNNNNSPSPDANQKQLEEQQRQIELQQKQLQQQQQQFQQYVQSVKDKMASNLKKRLEDEYKMLHSEKGLYIEDDPEDDVNRDAEEGIEDNPINRLSYIDSYGKYSERVQEKDEDKAENAPQKGEKDHEKAGKDHEKAGERRQRKGVIARSPMSMKLNKGKLASENNDDMVPPRASFHKLGVDVQFKNQITGTLKTPQSPFQQVQQGENPNSRGSFRNINHKGYENKFGMGSFANQRKFNPMSQRMAPSGVTVEDHNRGAGPLLIIDNPDVLQKQITNQRLPFYRNAAMNKQYNDQNNIHFEYNDQFIES